MPSTRALAAWVFAVTAVPSDSFISIPTTSRKIHDTYKAFRSRLPGTGAVIAGGCGTGGGRYSGALMMAKKKGGGKKKGAGKKQATTGGDSSAAGGSTSNTGGFAGGVAVAEAESGAAAAVGTDGRSAAEEGADSKNVNGNVIQNRVEDAESVKITGAQKAAPMPAGSGFGAPVAQPKKTPPRQEAAPRGAQPAQPAQGPAALPVAAQGGGGMSGPSSSLPPKLAGQATQDALSPGLAVEGNTDHQRVIPLSDSDGEPTEATFSDDVLGDAFDSINVESPDGRKMTPVEMLKYLRDNNISIDLETMNPVAMRTNAAEKIAAMFPYPAANLVAERGLGTRPKPSEFINAMMPLLPGDEPWNPAKIRPLPEFKDFLLANRLHGGNRAMNVISSFLLKAMGNKDLEKAKMLKGVAICASKAENSLTGPFRQAVMFAENRLAPCMGSTVCEEFSGNDGADAAATWVVLKACVAEWELRLREIRQEEIGLHDIFRSIPNPTEGLDEERTASITGSVQAMGLAFSSNEKIVQSLPPEIRFLEGSLGLNTTTEVRRFAMQEFCPKEGMSPEELRLRVRSMLCGMDQLPRKSYHQLQVAITDVYDCLVEGTPEEYNIYIDNWNQGENLSFDTYRVETKEKWRLKLRDYVTNTGYGSKSKKKDQTSYDSLFKELLPKGLWGAANVGKDDSEADKDPYVMVEEGWLDSLDYLDEGLMKSRESKQSTEDIKLALREADDDDKEDIFDDFMAAEEQKLKEYGLDNLVLDDFDPDIRDGPGEGMEMLDLGFDIPEGFEVPEGVEIETTSSP